MAAGAASGDAQATVAVGSLLVVSNDVVQAANDKQQIAPTLDKLARLGPPFEKRHASVLIRLAKPRIRGRRSVIVLALKLSRRASRSIPTVSTVDKRTSLPTNPPSLS